MGRVEARELVGVLPLGRNHALDLQGWRGEVQGIGAMPLSLMMMENIAYVHVV